jgi:soluble lytic murein transglycosylase
VVFYTGYLAMQGGIFLAMLLAANAPPPGAKTKGGDAVALLGRGHHAFRAGDYPRAAELLAELGPRLPHSRDYALYLAAESEFYAGRPARARVLFGELGRQRGSRFQAIAPWRVADCLWVEGDRTGAGAVYRRLLGPAAGAGRSRGSSKTAAPASDRLASSTALTADQAVGRFRLAELAAEAAGRPGRDSALAAARERARRAFHAVHVDFPAHPLAEEAARRAAALAPQLAEAPQAPVTAPATEPLPEERLKRAERLAADKRFEEAVTELERLPATLTAALRAERDYQLGMTKFRMRRDYGGASELLLGVVGSFSGEKAASAAFHGTRALSRVHRDDEAIAGYQRFVARFPQSRWAPEAQFLSGWLEINRGRLREGLPGLEGTLARYPRSAFSEDAAWFVALAHVLLGNGQAALAALDRYQRVSGRKRGMDPEGRVQYFRGRALALVGRDGEARAALRDLARRAPFSYYGLLARARLREQGESLSVSLPPWTGQLGPASGAPAQPALARADELLAAGLDVEAGMELVRGEAALLSRLGRERGLALLFDRYPRMQTWWRAYQLAEVIGASALGATPIGPARRFWEAAYPRAFANLVEQHAPAAGNPPLFLYAIMRKESGFSPREISYADARGLLQMLPATSARLARELDLPFSDHELFVPEVNIRLGAAYIGALVKKFGGSVPLAAGAYNAGPRAMMRWCDQNGRRRFDDFVELVTFEQTREYIKRVLAIYARYRYLYGGETWEPALEAGCQYQKSGPDY